MNNEIGGVYLYCSEFLQYSTYYQQHIILSKNKLKRKTFNFNGIHTDNM